MTRPFRRPSRDAPNPTLRKKGLEDRGRVPAKELSLLRRLFLFYPGLLRCMHYCMTFLGLLRDCGIFDV
jgi:hypothetical protein